MTAWRNQPLDGPDVNASGTRMAVRDREARIRRRDWTTYACAAIIAPSWAAAIWFMPDLRLTATVGLAAALWITFQVYRRSAARATPESAAMACADFHRALLERERDFARAMPLFYLVPVVLAQVAILAALFTSPRLSGKPALAPVVVAFLGTVVTVLVVAWKRWRREAMELQREIDALAR
jgi:hypothetical protein